jgi:2-keto-4-pentenoate hydratase/2-oxohepta-3-ene-1,7-dioic acid hydratase in catechol pathway
MEYVAGYTCGDDVSTRKWQRDLDRAGGVPQWCFSKVSSAFISHQDETVSDEISNGRTGIRQIRSAGSGSCFAGGK